MSQLFLDHLFCFVDDPDSAVSALAQAGLTESYRRVHPGQGTSNVCYCFDNAYLELLWISNADEASRSALARSRMLERSRWRETGAAPFGIAVRAGPSLPWTTWAYAPSYLQGGTIPVSVCADDPAHPLLFVSPGQQRPDEWRDGRAGLRQQPAGLREITGIELQYPPAIEPHADVRACEADGLLRLSQSASNEHRVVLTMSTMDDGTRTLSLPDFTWS